MTSPISYALVQAALVSPHYDELLASSTHHDAARDFIVEMLPHTQDAGRLLEMVASAMPANYSGNTLKEVPGMVRSAIKKGSTIRQSDAPISGARRTNRRRWRSSGTPS